MIESFLKGKLREEYVALFLKNSFESCFYCVVVWPRDGGK